MVRHADFLVCDSLGIEEYVKEEYKEYNPNTTFIAYGADIKKSTLPDGDPKLLNWFYKNGIKSKQYYLIVGRFVPENNYEVMIREIMASKTDKDLVIITNVEKISFMMSYY